MSHATLSQTGQLTIPADILQQWNIKPDEQLAVTLQNGIVTIKPAKNKVHSRKKNLKAFAGVGRGSWGDTPEAIQNSIHNLRNSWAR